MNPWSLRCSKLALATVDIHGAVLDCDLWTRRGINFCYFTSHNFIDIPPVCFTRVHDETMANQSLRAKVKELYKSLLYLGREYPMGTEYFNRKLKDAFMKNKDVSDPKEIKRLIGRGKYVAKEIEALYSLKKYRTLKKRYYDEPPPGEKKS